MRSTNNSRPLPAIYVGFSSFQTALRSTFRVNLGNLLLPGGGVPYAWILDSFVASDGNKR
jgi:hypothetical protein